MAAFELGGPAYIPCLVARNKYEDSTPELAHDIVASAQQLVQLEIALAKQEAKELAVQNGVAAGTLAAAGLLGMLAVLVVLPVLIVVLVPAHWIAALVWLALYVVGAAVLGLLGKSRLRLQAPEKTIRSLKETKAWALHQISSSSR